MRIALHYLLPVLAALLLCCCNKSKPTEIMEKDNAVQGVMVDDSTFKGLIVFYPQFSRIDLVCEKMPSKQDDSIVFCAEAAFTHELLDKFEHSNIDGDHVSGGKRYSCLLQ